MTDTGSVRKTNDDFYLMDEELSLFIVCDRVGGNLAGDVASQTCAKGIAEVIRKNRATIDRYNQDPSRVNRDAVAQLVQNAVQAANLKIYEESQRNEARRGMATTVDVLILAGDHAILGHAGDSRIYLLRDGKTHQLTSDHKVADEMIKQGLWTPEEAKSSGFANVLTRAVGSQQFVQSDTLLVELVQNDVFVLCSDGLHGYFKKDELAELSSKHELSRLPSELIAFANSSGGKDNITAVVVRMEEPTKSPDAFDAMRKSELLGKVPLFRYLSYTELMQVLNLVRIEAFAKGADLIREGDPSEELYVLVDGQAEVLKGAQRIATRGRGDAFGDMGIFDRAPRSATVRALEPTRAMIIARKELIALLRKDAQIAVKFLWALNQELSLNLRKTSTELAQAKSSLSSGEPPFHVEKT